MKRAIPVLVVIALLILILAGAAAVKYIEKYIPTDERADISSVLEVSGEDTAVFLNNERVSVTAITRDGQAYLPLEWVNENLNEKFYWDDVEKMLVYTLPDSIVYADKRTVGSGGYPLLLAEDDRIWLSVSLVGTYTDVRSRLFTDGGACRLYLNNDSGELQIGTVGKTTAVRVRGGIKSPIMTEVEKGGTVTVLDYGDEWARVLTEDGYIGYLPNKRLAGTESRSQVSTFVEPEYTSISLGEKVCLVWHQVLEESDNARMETLIAGTKGVNVIAPTWLMLTDNDGSYHSFADREYVDRAHELGMQVWAVLDNFNRGSQVDSAVLFARTSVRQSLIEHLMEDVRTYDLDGINLDIEGISQAAMPHYVQFIRELSVSCRRDGVILSIDNFVPSEYTRPYNRAEQGRVADYVIIMGYDEHYAGGEAGSVSSLPFVEQGIVDTLEEVPAEKVINAVPFYTRLWTEEGGSTSSETMSLTAAGRWVEDNQVSLYWQEAIGQYYGELRTDTSVQKIWMEDERSLGLKMALIDRYGLAGVACWKLGLDSESVWDVITGNE